MNRPLEGRGNARAGREPVCYIRCVKRLAIVVFVGACGGAAPAPAPARCATEELEAAEAQGVHDRCAIEGGEASDDEVAYQALREQLLAHQASLGAGEIAVSDADAMAVADGMWAYLDRVASQFTDHGPLDRAEDGAEALMRDRTGDGARTAVQVALAALEAVHEQLASAEPPDRCAEEADIVREANDELERCRADAPATP